jgi:hypothetical protein
MIGSVLVLALSTGVAVGRGQLLPPPGDRDIRVVYWELRSQSEVWLTLEPHSAKGAPAPLLTITHRFAGKYPDKPPVSVELRALAGNLWAPRPELWMIIDDHVKLDLATEARRIGLVSGMPSDYLSQAISIDTLREIAGAHRIAGSALGFEFELTSSQLDAIRTYLERILSPNPGQQPRREP